MAADGTQSGRPKPLPVEPLPTSSLQSTGSLRRSQTVGTDSTPGLKPLLSDEERRSFQSRKSHTISDYGVLKEHLEGLNVFGVFGSALALQHSGSLVTGASDKGLQRYGSVLDVLGEPELTQPSKGDEQGTLTEWEAISSISNLLVGCAMLSMPFAFRAAGWSAAVVLTGVSGLMLFTGLLIGWGFDATEAKFRDEGVPMESRDFAALAYLAFGSRGQALIGIIFTAELWMALEAFYVNIGVNMNILTGMPASSCIVGSGILSFIMLYTPMKLLAYVSMVSVFAIFGSSGAFIATGGLLLQEDRLPDYETYHSNLNAGGLLTAMGLSIYCFAGHPCLPTVYWSMRDRSKFSRACVAGFAYAFLFYLGVSSLGFYFFGDFVQNPFTSNIGQDLQGGHMGGVAWLRLLASAGFVIKLQGSLPIILTPIFACLQSFAGLPNTGLKVTAFRMAGVVLIVLIALGCQNLLTAVCSITGCALTMTTSLIFPCAMFYRLGEVSAPARVCLLAVCLLGVVLGVQGTLDAVAQARAA